LKDQGSGVVNRHTAFASAATLAVAAGITLGLWKLGGRGRQRDISADLRRSQDLQNIANAIDSWYRFGERKLPPDLAALRPSNARLSLSDPVTNSPYEYRPTGGTQFELCATFSLDSTAEPSIQPQFARFYSHPAGKQCFPGDAAQASLYR
jgi:hypothetical protein